MSSEIENESIEINVKTNGFLIDLWPDFIRNEEKRRERIYGSTRSVISLEMG